MLKEKLRTIGLCSVVLLLIFVVAGCGTGGSSGEQANKDNTSQSASSGEPTTSDEPITLKLAYNLPEEHHIGQGMILFADEMNKKTNGRVTIQLFPSSQLYRDVDMPQAITNRSIDLGNSSCEMWAPLVPAMDFTALSFLFPTMTSLQKALDEGGLSDVLNAELEKKGAKILVWAEYGPTNFANSVRQIKEPEDFNGLKIRGRGKLNEETIKALGGTPSFISSAEMYEALQRGITDGVSTGTTSMVSRKIYEVQKYLTISNDCMSVFPLAINLKSWEALPKDVQDVMLQVSADVTKSIREEAAKAEQQAIETLKANKMDVYTVTPQEFPKWREAVQPVWEMYATGSGDAGKKVLEIGEKYSL